MLRSALCLKLHAYNDTGAIIAAATTSIPEALGSGRTWDYRFCWLRDAAFVVEALRRLGHLAEGEAFVRFLRDVADAGPLQPLYGIGGERDLHEETARPPARLRRRGPVRIGNAAYVQRAARPDGRDGAVPRDDPHRSARGATRIRPLAPLVERLVDEAIASFEVEDTGLWEYRTHAAPLHLLEGDVLGGRASRRASWPSVFGMPDRARAVGRVGRAASASASSTAAYNEELGYFTQALRRPASRRVEPAAADARPASIRAIRASSRRCAPTSGCWSTDGLMLRYRHVDDFGETTSAFSICSFWWVEALAMMGEVDEAVALFQRLLGVRQPARPVLRRHRAVEPARLLGNFPQAYTHVGLIHAAITIGEILDARTQHFRAWS